MNHRTPSELCLLCQNNKATKTNSHIFPRFISTNFLGPKGTARKGFELNSESILEKKARIIQDSAKESYILCDECEAYFSIIEGLSSDTFSNWQKNVTNGQYKQTVIKDFLSIVDCENVDPSHIKLFVYSLFWRASISNHGLFGEYKLDAEFEEELRQTLLRYKTTSTNDFREALAKSPEITNYPFSILTAKSFQDETANVLMAPYSYDPYCLISDRFSFMLFRNNSQIPHNFLKDFSNTNATDCRMMILSEKLWHDSIVRPALEKVAKKALKKEN